VDEKMKKIALICIMILSLAIVHADNADMTVTVGSSGPTIDSVVVNDASPTAGSTTQITVTTQVTDTNGVDDIDKVNATFTVGTPANGKNVTTVKRALCTNVDTDTIQCSGTYNMQFYDPAITYTIEIFARDVGGATHTASDTFAYSQLVSLNLDSSTIAFGSMTIGQVKPIDGDQDMGTSGSPTIQNLGNVVIDAKISATDFAGSTDNFGAGQGQAKFGSLSYHALTNSERTENSLNLNFGANALKSVGFRLTIPSGALPETYTSTVDVVAVANS